MIPFVTLTCLAAPLQLDQQDDPQAQPTLLQNVDTDVITPMQRIMTARRADLGRYAFEPLRYLPGDGLIENPDFVPNRAPYRDARVLIAGANFGCGSSRETAVWAIQQMGYAALIAPGYGDIFYNNCLQSGLLPIVLNTPQVLRCAELARRAPIAEQLFTIELAAQVVRLPDGSRYRFTINPFRRQALLQGLDDIHLALSMRASIEQFEADYAARRPFLTPTI